MEAFMSLSLGELVKYIVGVFAALSVFIEFTPIKINPISALLNWIGKRTNKELKQELNKLKKEVDAISVKQGQIEENVKEREAVSCRVRILRFSDELRRGVKHSQESFDQTIEDIDTYEEYCRDHPKFKNNKTVVAKDRILAAYNIRLEMNDFL